MINLIAYLEAARNQLKDLHYTAKGLTFYGNHLLADRMQENLSGYVDSIKEVCYLGKGLNAPQSKDIYEIVLTLLIQSYNQIELFKKADELLKLAIYEIEELEKRDLLGGERNLLEGISENLMQSRGFIYRVLTE